MTTQQWIAHIADAVAARLKTDVETPSCQEFVKKWEDKLYGLTLKGFVKPDAALAMRTLMANVLEETRAILRQIYDQEIANTHEK